ncbi:CX module [Aphelenchoides fujianensis]|nr:CX module [Aphelenchoides fujianensis]
MSRAWTSCALLLVFAYGILGDWNDYNPDKPWESQVPRRPSPPPTLPPPAQQTRSLSGTFATDGSNQTRADVIKLITVGIREGYAVRRIKAFNDRVYLARYRRSYWLGTRYYEYDNRYYLATRDTCIYRMNSTERYNLEYEDGEEILDVVYHTAADLDCCDRVFN